MAKTTGALAATFIYDEYMPTMTVNSNEKIENFSVLLTRHHMIIKRNFGCGETVVAAAMWVIESKKLMQI